MTVEATAGEAGVSGLPAAPLYASPDDESATISRSFARQALIDTFSGRGARFGLMWILVMLLGAVFAPFIANSFPMLVKVDGHWSSPLLHHLTPSDVTLLAAFGAAVVLALTRILSFPSASLCIIWIVALMLPLTLWPAVYFDGWLPAPEKVSRGAGIGILAFLALLDLAVLIAIPLSSGDSRKSKLIIGIAILPVVLGLIAFKVRPPQNIVYDQYRTLQAQGRVQSILWTIVPYSANDYQRDVVDAQLRSPSLRHWMGTEQSGADVFSRMLHATRIALSIGFIATGISVLIGVLVGGIMGYFAGKIDMFGMRLIEILEAVPRLILLLTVCAFFGRNLYLMMVIIGLFGWTGDARFIRAEFFRLRNQDFVQAAMASGLPLRSVIFRHMLPNGITPVLVNSSFGVASAILLESTLSFLGLGLVDEPSWGQLLNQARAGGTGFQWWIATFPGLAIFLTVFAYNLIGEAMRDALDPRLRKRE